MTQPIVGDDASVMFCHSHTICGQAFHPANERGNPAAFCILAEKAAMSLTVGSWAFCSFQNQIESSQVLQLQQHELLWLILRAAVESHFQGHKEERMPCLHASTGACALHTLMELSFMLQHMHNMPVAPAVTPFDASKHHALAPCVSKHADCTFTMAYPCAKPQLLQMRDIQMQ